MRQNGVTERTIQQQPITIFYLNQQQIKYLDKTMTHISTKSNCTKINVCLQNVRLNVLLIQLKSKVEYS